jgi:GAF domain-containing protein
MEASVTYDNANADEFVRPLMQDIRRDADAREAVLDRLGLGTGPDEMFDAFARRFAEKAANLIKADETSIALVNFVTDKQHFSGRYVSPTHPAATVIPRNMPDDYGYCPHVIARGKALILDDVCDYPRFAGNIVVDAVGIRTYIGAPLINDGTTFGTICIIDREPKPWGPPALEFIKNEASDLMRQIHRRAGVLA